MGRPPVLPSDDFVAFVRELRGIKLPWEYVAVALNERGMLNASGKPWTKEAAMRYCRRYKVV